MLTTRFNHATQATEFTKGGRTIVIKATATGWTTVDPAITRRRGAALYTGTSKAAAESAMLAAFGLV